MTKIVRPTLLMEFKQRKFEIGQKYFGGKCFVCPRKFTLRSKGFAFHHRNYRKDRKTYKDFGGDTIAYNEYLFPEIIAEPWRFYLLCKKHHSMAEYLIRMKPERRYRLLQVVEATEPKSNIAPTLH